MLVLGKKNLGKKKFWEKHFWEDSDTNIQTNWGKQIKGKKKLVFGKKKLWDIRRFYIDLFSCLNIKTLNFGFGKKKIWGKQIWEKKIWGKRNFGKFFLGGQ